MREGLRKMLHEHHPIYCKRRKNDGRIRMGRSVLTPDRRRCSVYDRRPLICRLYGTSELMRCEGCTPERYLSEKETEEIIHIYVRYRKAEEERTVNGG